MRLKNYVLNHPATSYVITTFSMSWLGALLVIAPQLINGRPITKMAGIIMFPVMLLGPVLAGVILTVVIEGKPGLRNLLSRIGRWKVSPIFYIISILGPPCLIIPPLLTLSSFVSHDFSPNFFPLGLLFGIPAGLLEEVGWTGYAFPKMCNNMKPSRAAILLGLIWGVWHLPVIDFLGAASPHGEYLVPFFLSFVAILVAIRFFISWIYVNTRSILLAQLGHAVSTGCLVMFGPARVSPGQEVAWYGAYSILLWILVSAILILSQNFQFREKMRCKRIEY